MKKDADGNIIHESTRKVWEGDSDHVVSGAERMDRTDRRTVDIGGSIGSRGTDSTEARGGLHKGRYDRPTVPAGERARQQPERTRIYRPDQQEPAERDGAVPAVNAAAGDPMDDPPVGWLVIVGGPGRGRVATLGMGVNSIGRDADQRVPLDYGDELMSHKNHGTVTYDPRGRKFYVQHGGGTNLTYLDDEPVLAPRELEPLAKLQIGKTVLQFVPLCGTEFSWEDDPGER